MRFTWHFCICGGKRGKEKVEKWALMQEPASTTWWSIGRGTCMEVVRNRETHAGRSAIVKMIMASQTMGPHLSSSNSLSNHTALRLQQPTPLSSRISVESTRRNCPAYHAGKAPPSTFKYNYSLCLGEKVILRKPNNPKILRRGVLTSTSFLVSSHINQ